MAASGRVNPDKLAATCRSLRQVLQQPLSPALRLASPALAQVLPLLAELVEGVSDLNDRLVIAETTLRAITR